MYYAGTAAKSRDQTPLFIFAAGSAADNLATLAMIDLFRRHLETIGSRCKRLGFPASSTVGAYSHRPFASGRTDRRVEVL